MPEGWDELLAEDYLSRRAEVFEGEPGIAPFEYVFRRVINGRRGNEGVVVVAHVSFILFGVVAAILNDDGAEG